MSSNRNFLGVLVTTGLLAMGTTALLANGTGGNDRIASAVDYTSTQYSPNAGDDQTTLLATPVLTVPNSRQDNHK
jgi:hypothetical protein